MICQLCQGKEQEGGVNKNPVQDVTEHVGSSEKIYENLIQYAYVNIHVSNF